MSLRMCWAVPASASRSLGYVTWARLARFRVALGDLLEQSRSSAQFGLAESMELFVGEHERSIAEMRGKGRIANVAVDAWPPAAHTMLQ